MTVKHLPDCRVRDHRLAGNETRSPTSALPCLADPLLAGRIKQPGRAMRSTRSVGCPRQRMSLLRRSDTVSMPPPMRGSRRDIQQRRGLPERHTALNCLAQRQASSRSELRSTVDLHPGPPSLMSSRRPTAWDETRMPPQPFTTYIGTSTSFGLGVQFGVQSPTNSAIWFGGPGGRWFRIWSVSPGRSEIGAHKNSYRAVGRVSGRRPAAQASQLTPSRFSKPMACVGA